MRSNYQERKEARIERFKELAEKNEREGRQLYEQAHKMADVIPFGQPILVGHHSERSDRNFRGRIAGKFDRAHEASEKADYYQGKAATAESNRAISSDDPEAIPALKAKLENLEAMQEKMKATNKLIKKEDRAGLLAIGYTEEQANALFKPDFAGRIGFPQYALTNNNGNMARIRKRIEILEAQQGQESTEETIGPVRIENSVEDNRVKIFFPGKPSDEVRDDLKRSGFHWSRFEGAWMRHLTDYATQEARRIVTRHYTTAQPTTTESEAIAT